jgi:hypothetical protein
MSTADIYPTHAQAGIPSTQERTLPIFAEQAALAGERLGNIAVAESSILSTPAGWLIIIFGALAVLAWTMRGSTR